MAGVVVSARAEGSAITISVVTDEKGAFRFPASKLAPARYSLSIRAVGYDLEAPRTVDVAAGQPADVAVRLRKTKQLWTQLSDGEWGMSIPGTTQQKQFLENCNGCHSYQRIMKSTNKASEWPAVINRMTGYYPGSTPQNPQRLVGEASRECLTRSVDIKNISEWLASINLSADTTWSYELEMLPRVKGRGTRVAITEYDLPRPTAKPHDVIVDKDGMVWYCDFGANVVGKMDPKTGKVTDYTLPVVKKGYPLGTLYPGIPPLATVVPGYELVEILGLLAPSKMPPAIINRWHQGVARLLSNAELKEKFLHSGSEVATSSPEAFAMAIKSDMTKLGKVIKDAKLNEK